MEYPTAYSIQIGENGHLDTQNHPSRYLNHSCLPSCAINAEHDAVVALRDLTPGEALTINYLCTEWEMVDPFRCSCGSADCAGMIRGYRFLDKKQRDTLTPQAQPFLRKLLETQHQEPCWWRSGALDVDERGLLFDGVPAAFWAKLYGTPLYLYRAATVRQRLNALRHALQAIGCSWRITYAMRANQYADLLRMVRNEGNIGIACCSPREVSLALKHGFSRREISVTASWHSNRDLQTYAEVGVRVNLDSLSALRRWAALPGASRRIGLCLAPDSAIGPENNKRLSGDASRFGFVGDDIHRGLALARELGLEVDELRFQMGWGLQEDAEAQLDSAFGRLADLTRNLPQVTTVNVGGGLGWRRQAQDRPLSLHTWSTLLKRHFGTLGRTITCEPGAYVTASAGIMLVEVNTVEHRQGRHWIGVDTGHKVSGDAVNDGVPDQLIHVHQPLAEPAHSYVVTGTIHESIDLFSHAAPLPTTREGDLIAFFPVGTGDNHGIHDEMVEVLVL